MEISNQNRYNLVSQEAEIINAKIASAKNIVNTLGNSNLPFKSKGKVIPGLNTTHELGPLKRAENLVRVVGIKTNLVDTVIPRFLVQLQQKTAELKRIEIDILEESRVEISRGVRRGFLSGEELTWMDQLITDKKAELPTQQIPIKPVAPNRVVSVSASPEVTGPPLEKPIPETPADLPQVIEPPISTYQSKLPRALKLLTDSKAVSLFKDVFELSDYGFLKEHLEKLLRHEPTLDRRGHIYRSLQGAFFEEVGYLWLQKRLGNNAHVQVISPRDTRELFCQMYPENKATLSQSQFEYSFNVSVPDGLVLEKNHDCFMLTGVAEYTIAKLPSGTKTKQLNYFRSSEFRQSLERVTNPNHPDYSAIAFQYLYQLLAKRFSRVPREIDIATEMKTHIVIPKEHPTLDFGRFHPTPFTRSEYNEITSAIFEDTYQKIQSESSTF